MNKGSGGVVTASLLLSCILLCTLSTSPRTLVTCLAPALCVCVWGGGGGIAVPAPLFQKVYLAACPVPGFTYQVTQPSQGAQVYC